MTETDKDVVLDLYIKDVGKHPLLTREEEDHIVSQIEFNSNRFFSILMTYPMVWKNLVGVWEEIKLDGRSSSRLSAAYGSSNNKADELAEGIDKAMWAVKKIVDCLSFPDGLTGFEYNQVKKLLKRANLSQSMYFNAFDSLPQDREVISIDDLFKLKEKINELRGKLVTANLRLVVSFVYKYRGTEVPIMDLIQEGNVGLMRAAEKFSSVKGVKFSTYSSWWIRQGVIKALRMHNKSIRLPPHIFDQINKVSKAQLDLMKVLNREPSIAELSTHTDFPRPRVTYLLDLSAALPASLDVLTSEKDFIPEEGPLPDELVDGIKLAEDLGVAMRINLTQDEETVIVRRYGLDGRVWTLAEIGEDMGVSREKARLLEEAGLSKMKGKASFLKDYLP